MFLVKFDLGFRKIIGNKEVRLNLDLAVLFFRKFFNKIKNLVFFRKKLQLKEILYIFFRNGKPLVKKISKKNLDKINVYTKKTILLFLRFLTKLKFYIGYRI